MTSSGLDQTRFRMNLNATTLVLLEDTGRSGHDCYRF